MAHFKWQTWSFFQSDRLRRFIPAQIKAIVKKRLDYAEYRSAQLRREARKRLGGSIPSESDYPSPYPFILGIFSDNSYFYTHNIAACRDLSVRFKILDLTAVDWIQQIRNSDCDAFVASPSILLNLWQRLYEERLWVVCNELKKKLCPAFNELFLRESKRRVHDWLEAHDVPHPRTWVFFQKDDAKKFCAMCDYPLICKTNAGAASSGVFVVPQRRSANQLIEKAFSSGLLRRMADARERERGFILFQEYVPHDIEWRVVRVGRHFMCRKKIRRGDFASGSGDIGWEHPLPGMLDFTRHVTDLGGFGNMALDLFENSTGRGKSPFLVNELQPIIGPIKREDNVNEHMGRWSFALEENRWIFEPGFFYQNGCANLRIQNFLQEMGVSII